MDSPRATAYKPTDQPNVKASHCRCNNHTAATTKHCTLIRPLLIRPLQTRPLPIEPLLTDRPSSHRTSSDQAPSSDQTCNTTDQTPSPSQPTLHNHVSPWAVDTQAGHWAVAIHSHLHLHPPCFLDHAPSFPSGVHNSIWRVCLAATGAVRSGSPALVRSHQSTLLVASALCIPRGYNTRAQPCLKM